MNYTELMLKLGKSVHLSLRLGPSWLSFEKFRLEGNEGLASVKSGAVGLLQSKTGRYRIVEEDDFQQLLGQVQQVEHLRQNLGVLYLVAQEAVERRDEASIELLRKTLATLEQPHPPQRTLHPIYQELGHPLDPDDEVELESSRIRRPL